MTGFKMNSLPKVILAAFFAGASLFVAAPLAQAAPSGPPIAIAKTDRASTVDFESEILPIFRSNCLACHNRKRSKADLVLETPADILKGSEDGAVVKPGHGADSSLLKVAAHLAKPMMPPRDNKVSAANLTPEQLGLLQLWIDQGAKGEVRGLGPIVWQAPAADLHPIEAVALSPDGRWAACGRANRICLYDLADKAAMTRLVDPSLGLSSSNFAHRDLVESLAFSPDGNVLASGGYGEIKLWRRTGPTSRELLPDLAHQSARLVALGARGGLAAMAVGGKTEIYDLSGGKKIATLDDAADGQFAFADDGSIIAGFFAGQSVKVWKLPEGTLLAEGKSPADITSIACVDAGEIATGGSDNIIRLWKIKDASLSADQQLKAHTGAITAMQPMPGGRLVTASADGSICAWNVADGKLLHQRSHAIPLTGLAISPDGKSLLSIGKNNLARLLDMESGNAIADIKTSAATAGEVARRQRAVELAQRESTYQKSAVDKLQTAQNGSRDRLAKSMAAKSAADKELPDKQKKFASAAADKSAADAALAADPELSNAEQLATGAERLASDAQDLVAKAKSTATAAGLLDSITASADAARKSAIAARAAATSIAALPRLKALVDKAAAAEKVRAAAEVEMQTAQREIATASTEVKLAEAALKRGSDQLASANAAVALALEAQKKAEGDFAAAQSAAQKADAAITSASFSPDNRLLATASDDGSIHIWSASSGALLQSVKCANVRALAFAKQGGLIAVGATGNAVRWDLGGAWTLARTIGSGDSNSALNDRVNALQFSPDGKLLAAGSGEPSRGGQISLWNPDSGQLVRSFDDVHSDAVLALDFSPDGTQLASGAADRFVRVLDLKSGKVVHSLEGHTSHVLGVSWTPDGRTLASSSADMLVKIWDVAADDRKGTVTGFAKEVTAVHFYGTQGEAVAVGADGQIKIINETGAAVRTLHNVPDFLQAAAITPDGRTLIVGGQSGVLTVWSMLSDPPTETLAPPAARP